MSLTFKQKSGKFDTCFEFGEDGLSYRFDDSKVRVGGTIPYQQLPGRTCYSETKAWKCHYSLALIAIVVLGMGLHSLALHEWSCVLTTAKFGSFAFVGCLTSWRYERRRITIFPCQLRIVVLHDKQRQKIIDEIMMRRVAALKAKSARVDSSEPYYVEAQKFEWLLREGIVSEWQYQEARQRIAAMRNNSGGVDPKPASVN